MDSLQQKKRKERNGGNLGRKSPSPSHSNTGNTIISVSESNTLLFPLLMAAALSSCNTNSNSVVKNCLTKFISQQIQPHPATCILSLCPLLLRSESPHIATLTARFVGAASLLSFLTLSRLRL
ncbi:hypothetical protein V6N13_143246 [Hibiscus sabdariffa]|uniref:Uncharacterized protein n=1 Tax=Hibiscus sabdariffa TaxID=183260 RepID=A0ABR2FH58_9ROSI